jgi:AcrR family transcriptional regulator
MMAEKQRKSTVREARREMYRALILEAAERIFADAGFEAAKMQDVASAAGISLGTLYGIFEGKLELFTAIHEVRGRELIERASSVTIPEGDPLEAMLFGVQTYIEFLAERPNYLRIHLFEGDAWAFGGRLRSEEQRRQFALGLELFAEVYDRGVKAGMFWAEDPRLMGRLMIAQHQVLLSDFVQRGEEANVDELIERAQTHLTRLVGTPATLERLSKR